MLEFSVESDDDDDVGTLARPATTDRGRGTFVNRAGQEKKPARGVDVRGYAMFNRDSSVSGAAKAPGATASSGCEVAKPSDGGTIIEGGDNSTRRALDTRVRQHAGHFQITR